MKYLGKWSKFNENESVDSKFIMYLKDFINKGWLLDKEHLDDCFADLLDMGAAKHVYTTDSSKSFIDKYLVDNSTPVSAGFFYSIDIELPKLSKKKSEELLKVDNFLENYSKIIDSMRESVNRINSYLEEEGKENDIEVKITQDKRIINIYISTEKYFNLLSKEIGYSYGLGNYELGRGNRYNPLTFLYNKIKDGEI